MSIENNNTATSWIPDTNGRFKNDVFTFRTFMIGSVELLSPGLHWLLKITLPKFFL